MKVYGCVYAEQEEAEGRTTTNAAWGRIKSLELDGEIPSAPVVVILDLDTDRETLQRLARRVTEDLDQVLEHFEHGRRDVQVFDPGSVPLIVPES